MAEKRQLLVEKALSDTRESRHIEFKAELDVSSVPEWYEIIKDIVAVANSGGGAIAIGLDNSGAPTKWDPAPLLAEDPAHLVDRIAKFTGEQFDEVEVLERRKGRYRVAVVVVGPKTGSPLIFEKEGFYVTPDGRDKCAFAKGAVYFRHGAKSEPGLARDLQRFASNEEGRIRRELKGNIVKVTTAPRGAEVLILNQDGDSRLGTAGVRVVEDPRAPVVGLVTQDQTHPYLLHELLTILKGRIKITLNQHDLLCVRKVYKIASNSDFFYKPIHGSPQYSPAYIDWLAEQYRMDSQFFAKARAHGKP
jgi:hypothetical protein